MAGVNGAQPRVAFLVESNGGDDADAQTQLHIGLDHVGIHRRQHHVGLQTAYPEGLVDVQPPREAGAVGDDRKGGHSLQRQLRIVQQRMIGRHDHAVRPAIAGQRHQPVIVGQCLGGNADVGFAAEQHLGHLLRRSLVQVQLHVGVTAAEVMDGIGQRVACLGMRGRDRQLAGRLLRVFLAHPKQVLGTAQNAFDDRNGHRAGMRERGEALAGTHEEFEAQLLFQLADLATDAGLRCVQRPCHFGQVEAASDGLTDRTQLLEIHGVVSGRWDDTDDSCNDSKDIGAARCRPAPASVRK